MGSSDVKGKRVTVLGFGRSGEAVSKRLALLGADVFVSEEKPKERFDAEHISEVEALGARTEFGTHSERAIEADIIVLSPGVHLDIPILRKAAAKGIKVMSEIEIAYQLLKKPIIAVTGTNGKTTTTTLIGEMLKVAGKRVAVAGNIGFPLSAVDDSGLDFIVAEVSSYQLEAIEKFRPYISLVLNITEDHLERHKTMKEYAAQKARIFLNQEKNDYVIFNADDELAAEIVRSSRSRAIPFSRKKKLRDGVFIGSGRVIIDLGGKSVSLMDSRDIFIKGEHNLENALAASAAAFLAGADQGAISSTLRKFQGVEHRIEFVKTISGVSFYNDSKGTNPDSTVVALRALSGDIVLIAGGRDKGGDLSGLIGEAKGRVKALVLIGEATNRFRENFLRSGFEKIYSEDSMDGAVRKAFSLSSRGDQVLLSPACASFDMFKDYEARGRAFKDIVLSLQKGNER